MKTTYRILVSATLLAVSVAAARQRPAASGRSFEKVMIVVLENTDFRDAVRQPFLGRLAREGALLANFHAVAHPSQPNYIALAAGTTRGVRSNSPVTLDYRHIGDLLEAKGMTWKTYAEDYPGNCFLGKEAGDYARKHVPFVSFRNVQANAQRCRSRVVNANQLATDVRQGALPHYSMYVPNQRNDGHDTDVAYADRWLSRTFGPLLQNPQFSQGLLLVVTFDEADNEGTNHIYTSLWGPGVRAGSRSDARYDHYSLLRTIEEQLGLGTLGQNDDRATPITGVWK